MLATCRLQRIDAVIAHELVIHLHYLHEFRNLPSHLIVQRHDLFRHLTELAGRPVLLQSGYDDERVGTQWAQQFAKQLLREYDDHSSAGKCVITMLPIKGHIGDRCKEEPEGMIQVLRDRGPVVG